MLKSSKCLRVGVRRTAEVPGSALEDLLGDQELAESYRDGCHATLRLTAAMYHRFHAPHDCRVERVIHIWGDAWNANPIALKRVGRLFCKNERALIRLQLQTAGHVVTLVPVAAILVAGIRLRFLDITMDPRRAGPLAVPCEVTLQKGQEMRWFEHGSTIIVLAPKGFALSETARAGDTIRMGEPLMRLPLTSSGRHSHAVHVSDVNGSRLYPAHRSCSGPSPRASAAQLRASRAQQQRTDNWGRRR